MSSHHFVKDKQEPAVYIYSEESLNYELLGQLLEWCPVVIADEHVLYLLNHEPIKIDIVVQRDLSDDEISAWVSTQSNLNVIKLDLAEDKLFSIIAYLQKENHSALSLIACSDEHFAKLNEFDFELDIIQYSKNYKGFYIKNSFKKWKEAGSLFKIDSTNLEVHNLEKQNEYWKVKSDGIVEIKTTRKTYIQEFDSES